MLLFICCPVKCSIHLPEGFICSYGRPQGKSYLFFTQFKGEITGTKMEFASAYVSIFISKYGMIVFIDIINALSSSWLYCWGRYTIVIHSHKLLQHRGFIRKHYRMQNLKVHFSFSLSNKFDLDDTRLRQQVPMTIPSVVNSLIASFK